MHQGSPSGDVTHLAKTVLLSPLSLSLWVTGAPLFFIQEVYINRHSYMQLHMQSICLMRIQIFLNLSAFLKIPLSNCNPKLFSAYLSLSSVTFLFITSFIIINYLVWNISENCDHNFMEPKLTSSNYLKQGQFLTFEE